MLPIGFDLKLRFLSPPFNSSSLLIPITLRLEDAVIWISLFFLFCGAPRQLVPDVTTFLFCAWGSHGFQIREGGGGRGGRRKNDYCHLTNIKEWGGSSSRKKVRQLDPILDYWWRCLETTLVYSSTTLTACYMRGLIAPYVSGNIRKKEKEKNGNMLIQCWKSEKGIII